MMSLTPLEKQVIEMLLAGDDEQLAVLREQANRANIVSREMTGVGFYSQIIVPPESRRIQGCPTFKLGDVNGTASNVAHGFGFLLFVTEERCRRSKDIPTMNRGPTRFKVLG